MDGIRDLGVCKKVIVAGVAGTVVILSVVFIFSLRGRGSQTVQARAEL